MPSCMHTYIHRVIFKVPYDSLKCGFADTAAKISHSCTSQPVTCQLPIEQLSGILRSAIDISRHAYS